jgi:hypothetical protein
MRTNIMNHTHTQITNGEKKGVKLDEQKMMR